MESKEEKYAKIIQTAFALAGRHGVDNVSISMLSREAKISRGWIYKYIASDIEGVLHFCLKSYAEEFARFADLKVHETPESLRDSLMSFSKALAERVSKDGLVLAIYFGNISSKNLIGDVVRETDERYIRHLASNMKLAFKVDETTAMLKAKLFHSMRMGGLLFQNGEDQMVRDYLESLDSILDGLYKS